ncbi:MAG: hypothetical protein ILP12_04415 [Lachnospiraceae bacterium]|nr:hypothetical protein [Lachnospiraceae bacterium]
MVLLTVLLVAVGAMPPLPQDELTQVETTLEENVENHVRIVEGSVFAPDSECHWTDSDCFKLFVDLELYDTARQYAGTKREWAILEEKGARQKKVVLQQFNDLPEEKQTAIRNAWTVLENTALHQQTGTDREPFQAYVLYLGSFGDDCQIFSDDWSQNWPRVTCDSMDHYTITGVSDLFVPCHETYFCVYRQDEWMGLNIAYERGYLTLNDLRELISVRTVAGSVSRFNRE